MWQLLREIRTRLAMLLGFGKVTLSQDGGDIQTVQYLNTLEVRDGTYRMTEFGFSSSLPAGSDVLIGYLGGHRSNAVIFASNHPASRFRNLTPGESVLYNQWGLHILLTQQGIVVDAKGQDVTIHQAKQATIVASTKVVIDTPLLEVTGDIVDNVGSNQASLRALRDNYRQHVHEIEGVQTGKDSVISKTIKEPV
ncbi:phage baseplate assembly protein [Arsenophonus sp. aPb]|uniref:phage baseplate assembly protein domain-containing protein n=1 Tax=Arsenophonus sp. aPb TaxID=3041619 RepID=UPI002468AD03|nr:phage baseplate assembly protein [Arsenophonus sp. aPb]WGL97903.1 phage baseplate assembly protein [Arsenophonus sp. aPb]